MFWSMHHFLLTTSREILIVFWARNNSRVEATLTNIPLTLQLRYIYCIAIWQLPMQWYLVWVAYCTVNYLEVFTRLYFILILVGRWLGMVRGCDTFWRRPHIENQNKKKHDRLRLLETSKIGNDSLVFDMYYLLSKRCFDLALFICSPWRQKF